MSKIQTHYYYYYYAVRSNPEHIGNIVDVWSRAPQWDIVLLIKCHTVRFNGMYRFTDGHRYWLSSLTWEEFDMLTAFGVEWVKGFDKNIKCFPQHIEPHS